jgi:uncharacterized protein YndB with AHSA1/START domain
MTVPDRIEKRILLRAPFARVWSAISDAQEFGVWFGVAFERPFVAGSTISGSMRPTQVDPEVAKMQEPYAGQEFTITVERIEPMSLFSFRWHPFAIEPGVDYAAEATTLVAFTLTEAPDGTLLTVTESGFDRVPLERRASAFAANEGGWEHQTQLIEKYLRAHTTY